MQLEGKVFVYMTVHELIQDNKLFRIVKFHRIQDTEYLRKLVSQPASSALDNERYQEKKSHLRKENN